MKDLTELLKLTALIRQREEATMTQLADAEHQIQQRVDGVGARLAQAYEVDLKTGLARQQSGTDALWQMRLGQDLAMAQTTLASLRARQEAQRLQLADAVGRDLALAALHQQSCTKTARANMVLQDALIAHFACLKVATLGDKK